MTMNDLMSPKQTTKGMRGQKGEDINKADEGLKMRWEKKGRKRSGERWSLNRGNNDENTPIITDRKKKDKKNILFTFARQREDNGQTEGNEIKEKINLVK